MSEANSHNSSLHICVLERNYSVVQLFPLSRVLVEKLIVSQPVRIF
jgi:hypothetical protein